MNATNTHTPGPWHVGHDSSGTLLIVAGDGENFDGGPCVYDSDKPETRPMSDANARLIAAAPALLAALDAIARGLTNGQKERGETFQTIAAAALRIARGA